MVYDDTVSVCDLPTEHVLQPISQSMHSPVSGSCTCPETQETKHKKPACLSLELQPTQNSLLYIYLYHRTLFGRPHSGVCSVPDIWHICCRLCRVHNWLCRAGRHSDPCQDRVPGGSVSDSDLGTGNVPVHLRLRRRRTTC